MKEYYLVQNLMYNHKHIVKKNWIHKLFGEPRLTIDFCKAYNKEEATVNFIERGHHLGILHDTIVSNLKEDGYLK